MNQRKFMAREGLIVIAILVVSAISFYLGHLQNTQISKRLKPSEKEIKAVLSQVRTLSDNEIVCPNGQKIRCDSKLTDEDVYWACTAGLNSNSGVDLSEIPDKQLYNLAKVPVKERPFLQRMPFSNWGLFFLIGAYPLYWLVRFTVWAIRTLRYN